MKISKLADTVKSTPFFIPLSLFMNHLIREGQQTLRALLFQLTSVELKDLY
jgi:hypothetical protein